MQGNSKTSLDIPPNKILQQPQWDETERQIQHFALLLALYGDTASSREIIELLFNDGGPARPNWHFLGSLSLAWKLTEEYPRAAHVPGQASFEEMAQRVRTAGIDWSALRGDEQALEECLRSGNARSARWEDSSSGGAALDKSRRLVRGLCISLRMDEGEDAGLRRGLRIDDGSESEFKVSDLSPRSAGIFRQICARLDANQQLELLGEAEVLWPYWIRGLLADGVGLQREEVHVKGQRLVSLFAERLADSDVRHPLAGHNLRELLQIAADMQANAEEEEERPNALKNPASEAAIQALEQRLGVTLPDDYKEFLRVSDGFGDETGGIVFESSIWPTQKVKWNAEEYIRISFQMLDLPREILDLASTKSQESGATGVHGWDLPVPLLERVLELGRADISSFWLVHPDVVEQARRVYAVCYERADPRQKKIIERAIKSFAGSREEYESLGWCYVTWAAGGSIQFDAYASFRRFVEGSIQVAHEVWPEYA